VDAKKFLLQRAVEYFTTRWSYFTARWSYFTARWGLERAEKCNLPARQSHKNEKVKKKRGSQGIFLALRKSPKYSGLFL
jgi:hypothetical protein